MKLQVAVDNIDQDLFRVGVRGGSFQPSDDTLHAIKSKAFSLLTDAYQKNLVRPYFAYTEYRLCCPNQLWGSSALSEYKHTPVADSAGVISAKIEWPLKMYSLMVEALHRQLVSLSCKLKTSDLPLQQKPTSVVMSQTTSSITSAYCCSGTHNQTATEVNDLNYAPSPNMLSAQRWLYTVGVILPCAASACYYCPLPPTRPCTYSMSLGLHESQLAMCWHGLGQHADTCCGRRCYGGTLKL